MKTYFDVTVRIEPGGERSLSAARAGEGRACYRVIASSRQGEGESILELPFSLGELSGVVFGVAQTVRDIGGAPQTPGGRSPREFGERLYEALFAGEVRSILERTIAVARERPNTGVRIRLAMNPRAPGMAEVASMPWELMRNPRDLGPLVMSNRTVFVRSLDVAEPTEPLPYDPPLRILALLSNPHGTGGLNLEEERDRVERNWALLPGVRVDFVRPVRSELLRQLAAAEYHVIHYMGHGDFDHEAGGRLLLEREDGSADPITGEELGVYLADELTLLRLVFLNACKTATTSGRDGIDPFSGVATALLKAGVPAVVAMQFPISDPAAIAFADTFYQRIAQRYPVDAAMAEARKALYSDRRAEWATPVLFLRSKDGVLFEPAPVREPEPEPDAPRPRFNTPVEGIPRAADEFRVFLATPNEALRPWHRQLTRELAGEGMRVADTVPPPYESADHSTTVSSLVGRADLCVHLLGDAPGEPFDEPGARATYTREQLRIGLEADRPQLVIIPEHVDIEAIEDAEYQALIRSLIARPRDGARFEVARIGRQQMKEEILAKRRRLEEAKRAASAASTGGGPVRQAFVDLHVTDLSCATDLVGHLGRRNIVPIMMPAGDNSPVDVLSQFEDNLSKVPLFIVVFGSVTRDWVVSRLSAAVQFVTTHGTSTRIGVYVAPPVKGSDQLRFPPFYDVAANMAGFDAASVDALIHRASGAAI